MPYRDVLDNHAPLFHVLMAPLLALVGERADALFAMRFAMFPLFGAVLLCVWALGRSLFSPRVGLWAVVFAALWPQHFLTSLEFRADDLWALLWLASLAVLLGAPPAPRRSFVAGLLAGAALAVSLKTGLLVVTLAGAVLVARGLTPRGPEPRPDRALRLAAAWLAGGALIPLLVALYFAARGGLGVLVDAIWNRNALPGLWMGSPWRRLVFPLALPVLWLGARALVRGEPAGRGPRRAVMYLAGAGYYAALVSLWPLLTPQNYLPVEPLAALLSVALVLGMHPGAAGAVSARVRAVALAVLLCGAAATLLLHDPPWRDRTAGQRQLMAEVLALTGPDEYVLDLKGETVFRRRPVRWVLETVTQGRFRRGLLADTISAELAATRTAVAVRDHYKLPPRMRAFLNRQYLPVGAVRVLGQRLAPPSRARIPDAGGPRLLPAVPATIPFEIGVPERYRVLNAGVPAAGRLDGTKLSGARWLAVGRHEYLPAPGETALVVLWSRAAEKGYAPRP
jgi:hypothetical protein